MRPKKYCEKYLPWTNTSKDEINDACVNYETMTIKACDACIDKEDEK